MNQTYKHALSLFIAGLFAVRPPGLTASAKSKCWYCDHDALVNIPISLAIGTIRTPEFSVKREPYMIVIAAKKGPIPFEELNCDMGLELYLSSEKCNTMPFLQADWAVWDGDTLVARGSIRNRSSSGAWAQDSIERWLGGFVGASKKKYLVRVKVIEDESPLNVAEPRLMIISTKESFWRSSGQ